MKHLSQDQMLGIINRSIDKSTRLEWVQHLVDCHTCGQRFRAHREAHLALEPDTKPWGMIAWAAAIAAIFTLVFVRPAEREVPTEIPQPQFVQTSDTMTLLEEIQQINQREAIASWGTQQNISDLVKLHNRG
ncbi:MAG: hypothetical protein KDC35_09740 [Acidobacteria bacterium]|nr:hypothetical protein [Acidobacteriota bacterium]